MLSIHVFQTVTGTSDVDALCQGLSEYAMIWQGGVPLA